MASNVDRQRAWRERQRAAGLTEVKAWVPVSRKNEIETLARKLRAEHEEAQRKRAG